MLRYKLSDKQDFAAIKWSCLVLQPHVSCLIMTSVHDQDMIRCLKDGSMLGHFSEQRNVEKQFKEFDIFLLYSLSEY